MTGSRTAVAALIAVTAMAAASSVLAGCGSGSAPATAATASTLGAAITPVPLSQVRQDITRLYQRAPGIASYSVKDVEYTTATRDKVLGVCANGAAASDEDALESAKIMACAPLIYFLYSYGTRHPASGALGVANELYSYAVTHITGPVSTQQTLDKLLRSWGLPVTATAPAHLALTGTAKLVAALVTDARRAMNTSAGVHIDVTSRTSQAAGVQHASFDSGTSSAAETLTDGRASGRLRVTAQAVYFSGNRAGLVNFFGLAKQAAARVGGRWVTARAGTSQYTSLASGTLIASIPATILPASNAVTVTSTTAHGVPVYRLAWTSFIDNASTPIHETLDLAASGSHAPVSETSRSARSSQVDLFTQWGSAPTVLAPPDTVSFKAAVKR